MNQQQEEDFEFFLTYKDKIQALPPKAQDYLGIYMSSRLAVFVLESKDISREDISKFERLILKQLDDPTEKRADLVSNCAEKNAYSVKNNGKHKWTLIGYWSCICYWFMLSKTRDMKFLDYIYVSFVDGVDYYFSDDDPSKIINENENFLKAYAVAQLNNLDIVSKFIEWTKSTAPGVKLTHFEA